MPEESGMWIENFLNSLGIDDGAIFIGIIAIVAIIVIAVVALILKGYLAEIKKK